VNLLLRPLDPIHPGSKQKPNNQLKNQPNKYVMDNKVVLILLAILLPPVAVALKKGAGKDLLINVILLLIFFIPAVIHALIVVL
jgi:uncharacterized membrane protein YqaE (UPF0057 family)